MSKLAFVTKKVYTNNTEKIIIKKGFLPNQEKAKRTRFLNKIKKQMDYREHDLKFSGQQSFNLLEKEKEARIKLDEKYAPKLENIIRASNRSRNNFLDILKCNDFQYFVTLTFDKEKVERLNDNATRLSFSKWADNMKKQFPNMTYVAVPEYHAKGGLHYHLLVGNITADELGFVDSGYKTKKEQTIFNITKWKYGFSTATEITEGEAAKFYIAKYLLKTMMINAFTARKNIMSATIFLALK